MAKKITAYVALGFSQPGCMCNSVTPHVINNRRDIAALIRSYTATEYEARNAMRDLDILRIWSHAKRFGLSSIFRELRVNAGSEVLCFMGMTEAEYDAAAECED